MVIWIWFSYFFHFFPPEREPQVSIYSHNLYMKWGKNQKQGMWSSFYHVTEPQICDPTPANEALCGKINLELRANM